MLYIEAMETKTATTIFESLSSGWRLGPSVCSSGRARRAWWPATSPRRSTSPRPSLSFHLKALTHAGMVSVEQEGRFLRYRANLPLMADLIAYLTEECCAGVPGQCTEGGRL